MVKYFFDIVRKGHPEYDYQGREFSSLEKAMQLAELIALDLEISPQGEWVGSSVTLRDQRGRKLFTRTIGEPELMAA
jgi:hypothetical protein